MRATYLLDTNVVSELRKPRPHGAVVAWMKAADENDLHLSGTRSRRPEEWHRTALWQPDDLLEYTISTASCAT